MFDSDFLPARTRRIASGGLFLLIAAGGFWMLQESRANFTNMVMPADPGPFSLPAICLIIIGITGVALFGLGLMTRSDAGRTPATAAPKPRFVLPVLFLLSVLLLPILLEMLGTMVAVALFSTVWIFALDVDLDGVSARAVLKALFFGIASGLVVHGLFVRLLNLPLP